MANGLLGVAEATASPEFEKAAEGTVFQEFAQKVAEQIGKDLVETLCQVIAKDRGAAVADALEQSVKKVVSHTAQHLAGTLCWEHQRHIEQMFKEVLRLRSELSRVAEMMQGYLQRERQLQDMLDQLSKTPFNNVDETLHMAMNYRQAAHFPERSQWPSTTQADKGGSGPVAEGDELQLAFQEPMKAPLTISAGATPSSSATVAPADKDTGSRMRPVEISQMAERATSTLCELIQRESSVLSSANLAGCQSHFSQLADRLGVDSSSGSTRMPDSNGVPGVTSSPDDLSRSSQTVSRNLLVDGFNQAIGAAECSLEIGRMSAELRPKLAELRQDLQSYIPKRVGPPRSPRQGTATPPTAAQTSQLSDSVRTASPAPRAVSPVQRSWEATATPPLAAPTFQLSGSWRTISPAPSAVSPAQRLREVSPMTHSTPASPRIAPPIVISALRQTPPVTSTEMPLQSPPSGLRVPVSPRAPPPLLPFPLPPRLHHGSAISPASPAFFSPACLGSGLCPAHPSNCLQMDLGKPQMEPLGAPRIWPPAGDLLATSLRADSMKYMVGQDVEVKRSDGSWSPGRIAEAHRKLVIDMSENHKKHVVSRDLETMIRPVQAPQNISGPPAIDVLTASLRALQQYQTPQRQRTPPSQQAAGVSPDYC